MVYSNVQMEFSMQFIARLDSLHHAVMKEPSERTAIFTVEMLNACELSACTCLILTIYNAVSMNCDVGLGEVTRRFSFLFLSRFANFF